MDSSPRLPNESPDIPAVDVSVGEMGQNRGKRASRKGSRPALAIAYRSLTELQPYARNARTHTPEQVAKIRASLHRFGWTNPMLIAGNDMIAGHARLAAAIAMANEGQSIKGNPEPWRGPTVDLSHLSQAERRAYILADNRLAEEAGWDYDMLRLEVSDLSLGGFDLTLTGFDNDELTEILVPPGDAAAERVRELTDAEDAMMDRAWSRLVADWHAVMGKTAEPTGVPTSFTRGALQVHYLRSLFFGVDLPRQASLAYTPHRAVTSANKGSIFDQLTKAIAVDGRGARASIRWACAERPYFDTFCCGTTMPIQGTRAPNDFPALLARDLIDEFTKNRGAAVLDPCHGWGGRMLGFMLSERAALYHGFDPSPLSHAGVKAMFEDLAALHPDREKAADLQLLPFEDAVLPGEAYDFAITSPPYFDVEQYEGELSSHRRYGTFAEWAAGFYAPLIMKVGRALKPGAVFALQVGSQQYPLKNQGIEIARGAGLMHVETRPTGMVNNRTQTEEGEGEVIVLLRKPA